MFLYKLFVREFEEDDKKESASVLFDDAKIRRIFLFIQAHHEFMYERRQLLYEST